MYFEILVMYVILDSNFKPWFLEVNHTPSFSAYIPFDYDIKFNVIRYTIIIMNINYSEKI